MFRLFGEELFSILLKSLLGKESKASNEGICQDILLAFLPCRGSPDPSTCYCNIILRNIFIFAFLFKDKISSTSCESSAIAYLQPSEK